MIDVYDAFTKYTADTERGLRRLGAVATFLSDFPPLVEASINPSVEGSFIRCWIYLHTQYLMDGEEYKRDPSGQIVTDKEKEIAASAAAEQWMRMKFLKPTKEARDKNRLYMCGITLLSDEEGEFELWLMLENVNAAGCTLRTVERTITVTELDCPGVTT